MDIQDFKHLLTESGLCTVHIFSLEKGEDIYFGNFDDIPANFLPMEIGSIDAPTSAYELTINVD